MRRQYARPIGRGAILLPSITRCATLVQTRLNCARCSLGDSVRTPTRLCDKLVDIWTTYLVSCLQCNVPGSIAGHGRLMFFTSAPTPPVALLDAAHGMSRSSSPSRSSSRRGRGVRLRAVRFVPQAWLEGRVSSPVAGSVSNVAVDSNDDGPHICSASPVQLPYGKMQVCTALVTYLLDILLTLESCTVYGTSDGDCRDSAGHDPSSDGLLCRHDMV